MAKIAVKNCNQNCQAITHILMLNIFNLLITIVSINFKYSLFIEQNKFTEKPQTTWNSFCSYWPFVHTLSRFYLYFGWFLLLQICFPIVSWLVEKMFERYDEIERYGMTRCVFIISWWWICHLCTFNSVSHPSLKNMEFYKWFIVSGVYS